MSIYETQRKLITLSGNSNQRPMRPPDKQVLFWDVDNGKLYGVNDAMQWVMISPSGAKNYVDTWTGSKLYSDNPSALLFHASANTKVISVSVKMLTPFNSGVEITVGDSMMVNRLMSSEDNDPQDPDLDLFVTEPNITLVTERDINVYISSTSPPMTQGEVEIHLVYDHEAFL